MKKEIPIMFCFDNNYVIPAAVAFYSLLENCDKNNYYKLFVLHSDITEKNQDKLKRTIDVFSDFSSLEFIDMTHKFDALWNKIKTKGHFTKEVMYKVLVSSIFPQYDKIIVSDVDVVFLGNISESYLEFNINQDIYLAGVKAVGKIMRYMENYKPAFNDEEIKMLSCFCGGYIVFNLKKIREDDMESKFIECFEKDGYRINQMEQDVLNLCCYPKTTKLHLKYVTCSYMWDLYKKDEDFNSDINYTRQELKEAMNNPVQLHYATSVKPWKNVDSTKSEEWFKYIVKTPFLTEYLQNLPSNIVFPEKENDKSCSIENSFIKRVVKLIKKKLSNIVISKKQKDKSRSIKNSFIKRIVKLIKKNPLFFLDHNFYIRNFKKIKKKTKKLIIVDDSFPDKLSAFRFEEFFSYLNIIENSSILIYKKETLNSKEKQKRKILIDNFKKEHPKFKDRIHTSYSKVFKSNVAVLTFLNNIYNNIEFLEKNDIDFIFTLYPGGGFSVNNKESDLKLERILSSPNFKKVIVTQRITYDYLIKRNFCNENKIKPIFGIVTPAKILNRHFFFKKSYGYNKNKLDVCFVAHKYSEKGIDKGYDLFIEIARILTSKYDNIYFHVVGGFSENDIDISMIKNRIKFYGIKNTKWFKKFYVDKDLIISPNIPYILSNGSFDGFPTGSSTEAMLNKVALFCTDELNLNHDFVNKKELVIIKPNIDDIIDNIEYYYHNYKELKKLAKQGYKKAKTIYSKKNQIKPRIKIIKEELRYH